MSYTRTANRISWLSLFAWFLCVLVLICTVPYHVAMQPSYSASWIFGYNNRVCIALVFAGALLTALTWREIPRLQHVRGKPLTHTTLVKSLAVVSLLALVLALLFGWLDGASEGVYTVDRVRLLLEGKRPFRDFNYAYGPAFLYIPYAIARLTPLSASVACMVSWWAITSLGYVELFFVLRWSGFAPAAQRKTMLLPAAMGVLSMLLISPSYSITRFLTSGFLAMALARALGRARTKRSKAVLMLLAAPCAAVCFAVSPETGLAYAAGIVLFLLCFLPLRSPVMLAGFVGTVILLLAVCLFAKHLGLFLALQSFSSGGFNYPVCPALHVLLFLIALGITATYMRARVQHRQGTPFMALCCVAIALLPGALGRADPLHVWSEGLGICLCALLVSTSTSNPARHLSTLMLLVFVAVPVVRQARVIVNTFGDPIAAKLLRAPFAEQHPAGARLGRLYVLHLHHRVEAEGLLHTLPELQGHADHLDVPALFHMPQDTVFYAPFSFYARHSAPYHSPAVQYGYYLGTVNVLDPRDVRRKLSELVDFSSLPLLIPAGAENSCIEPAANAQSEVRTVMWYPYRAPAVHLGNVTEPVCAYLRAHYHPQIAPTEATLNYGVWIHNAP